jgi:hypothetical protein
MTTQRFNFLDDLNDEEQEPTRYNFVSESDAEKIRRLKSTKICKPIFDRIRIPVNTLTKDGSDWFHAVEIVKEKTKKNDEVIRIRVITKDHGGINVMIPLSGSADLYKKYRDLRFLIRNTDYVSVTFPNIYVKKSPFGKQLFLFAYDFKVCKPEEPATELL